MESNDPILPDIAGLTSAPVNIWENFGDRLRRIGFNEDYLDHLCSSSFRSFEFTPLSIWHARQREDPAAHVYRMFCVRDPVSEREAIDALGSGLFSHLIQAGLLALQGPGLIVSPFDLKIFDDRIILCDDLAWKGDVAFGVGPGTAALCRAMPRLTPPSRMLDVGCGAGAVALYAAKFARSVLASDVNPRALAFLHINAAINRVTNIETRLSDLFTAFGDETFDLITAQLPFIPEPPGAPSAAYRFGGRRGNELTLRVLQEVPPRLRANGRALIVCMQPVPDDSQMPSNKPLWHDLEEHLGPNARALLFLGPETDADAYTVRYAAQELDRGKNYFDPEVFAMRDHLKTNRIRGVCPAVLALENAASPSNRFEAVQVSCDLWARISNFAIERFRTGLDLLRQDPAVLWKSKLRIAPNAKAFGSYSDNKDDQQRVYLALQPEYLVPGFELTGAELALLRRLDRAPDFESALAPADDRETALQLVRRAIRAGVLGVNEPGIE